MRALVVAATVPVVVWVLAVVGTALLWRAVDRRAAPYAPFTPVSAWDRPVVACVVQLTRALRHPQLWWDGLVHAVQLLAGRDLYAELSERDVKEMTDAAWQRVSERAREARQEVKRDRD